MSKDNKISSSSVFGQLNSFIPKDTLRKLIAETGSDRYCKKFKTLDHMYTMLFAAFTKCSALREIVSAMVGFAPKLYQMGMNHLPRRNTLAEANARRDSVVFEQIYQQTYKRLRHFLPDSYPKNQQWMKKLFLVDSTTITLFKNILKSAGNAKANGKKKGGIKIHVGLHLQESVPSLVCLTASAAQDRAFMPKFRNMESGTVLVFDKAYVNYTLYNHWTKTGVFFVSRLHGQSKVSVTQERTVSLEQQTEGVYRDQLIELGHSCQKEKVKARLIYYYSKEKNLALKFITNDLEREPSQIAQIYAQRWQIEVLFKRLKQNLQFADFIGDNENAIRIQIWCNLLADLLITVIRKGMKRKIAHSTAASMVRLHIFSFVKIRELFLQTANAKIFHHPVLQESQTTLYFGHSPPHY